MIFRRSGGSFLADREWLAEHFGLSQETIRKRLTPVSTDPETGRALYDVDADTEATLRAVKPRRRTLRA